MSYVGFTQKKLIFPLRRSPESFGQRRDGATGNSISAVIMGFTLRCRVAARTIISIFSLVTLSCLISISSFAQKQPVIAAPPLVGDSVKVGKVITVVDTVAFDVDLDDRIAQTKRIDNIVALYIDGMLDKVLPDTFHVVVRVQVNYIDGSGTDSLYDTLTLVHSKDYPDTSKDAKLHHDFKSAQVKVLSVTITGAPADSVRMFLILENMMVIERYFTTSCSAVTSVDTDTSTIATHGELSVSWPADDAFIPLYELEWTWVDKSALDSAIYETGGELDPDLVFKNNSTRVQLSGNSYKIPVLYDGDGTLFYRVRTLQYAPDNEIIPGIWSSDNEDGLGSYVSRGHQRNLNWQATTSYAEEGKRKSVVQYFDGSLMARQTVTKDNTTDTTIVAETLYDKQGRPVIQVLPAPSLSSLIAYNPLFNKRGINTAEYDKSVYDTLVNASEYCATGADSMSSVSGAAKYYSPQNPLAGSSYHQYIPDARGYAFAETRYTRDNTGRIDRQGGVADTFRVGTEHDTRYFYGSPEQKELDALFGTEAGDGSHYEKNMVRDANGQYSVSYVDMHGRTVATALAGGNPASLERLDSYNSIMQTDSLLTAVNNVIKESSITSTRSILVPADGTYTFNYTLSPESFSLEDCKDSTICYDCLYDLTITITDNCNSSGFPKVVKLSNFSLFKEDSTTYNLDTTCMVANTIDTSFSVFLEEGSYDVTKVLSISKPGMIYYRDSIFIPHNTCKSYEQLVLEQLDSIRQRIECEPDSAVTNLTVAYREQMLMDLTPLVGQYAQEPTDPPTPLTQRCFSIFDINPQTRKPYYQSAAGAITPEEFISNFQDSWAEDLLRFHPEYPLLVEFEKLKSAYTWEADFSTTETYADAVAKGYLNPTGSTSAPANLFTVSGKTDSLFIDLAVYGTSVVNAAKQSITDSLLKFLHRDPVNYPTEYYTLWGLSTGIVKCNNYDPACFNHWNQSANVFNTDSLCTGDLDQAWRMFRSQYLRIREDWVDSYIRQRTGIYADQFTPPCIPVFPDRDISSYLTNINADPLSEQYGNYNGTGQDIITAQNNLDSFLLNNCRAYAEKWWQDLAPCGYTSADKDTIIARLIQVAYEGADKDHPFGSSTVKPSSTHTDRSFVEVIREYNEVNYPPPFSKDPVTCNGYLIPYPKPYEQPGIIINLPIIAAPDSCSCVRINDFHNLFMAEQSSYGSFSNYMQQAQGTVISQGKLDSLLGLCNNSINCTYLEKPILLPPVFQCGTGDVCVDCAEAKTLYEAYKEEFATAIPTYAEPDTIQRRKNELFTNYMNHHLGFVKTHIEYLDFLDSCGVDSSMGPACDSLLQIEEEYRAIHKEVVEGKAAHGLRVTEIFREIKEGMNGLLEWRRRASTGYTLSPRYRYQPTDSALHNKFYEIAYTTASGSDSVFNLIMPINLASVDNSTGLFTTMLNTQTVLGTHFTGAYTPADLLKQYYGITLMDEWGRWRMLWGSEKAWKGDPGCSTPNFATYYGVSAPDSLFLEDNTCNLVANNFYQAFYKLPSSVTTLAGYVNYIDTIRIKITNDGQQPVTGAFLDTLKNSDYIYQLEDIRRVVDFYLDTLWAGRFWQSPYAIGNNGDFVKVKLEMMDGSIKEAHYFMSNSAMITKVSVDSGIYNPDCHTGFAAYYNFKKGTNYTYEQVDSIYQSTCGKQVMACAASVCDSSAWTLYNPGDDLDINADLYNYSYNNISSDSLFFQGGYFISPSIPESDHYVLVNKQDSIDAGSAAVVMQWRVKTDSLPAAINPFIRRGSHTYVGAEWIRDPTDTSWWIGATIISGQGGAMLGGMGLQSGNNALIVDWVKISSADTGTILYFDDFLFTSGSCASSSAFGPFLCGKEAMDSAIILNMDPCRDTLIMAVQGATYYYDIYQQNLRDEFEKAYMKKCLDAGKLESFTVTHPLTEYHYTLYYYDQAGNLVKTVPPEGVRPVRDSLWLDSVIAYRKLNLSKVPAHTLATTYRYNSLNQVISQHSPDGGLSRFWYDRLGRLVVSQNAQQLIDGNYSYTLYDVLGRISEVGQKKQVTAMTDVIARSKTSLGTWLGYTYTLDATTVIAEQVTKTVYDTHDPETAVFPLSGYVVNRGFQKAYTLRNRVSHTRFYDKLGWNSTEPTYSMYDNSSIYSYDIHGNVDTLVHHYRVGMMASHGYNQFKAMAYKYDLISGKVNEVHYQPGMADELYHRYEYDAENRLTDVYTVNRKPLIGIPVLEEHEARYTYYRHGPLARMVLGQQQVQGVDYAYTLQGWIKGVNSDSLVDEDGRPGSIVGRDAYRFSLNYYNNDYSAIGAGVKNVVFPGHSGQLPGAADYRPLYNGNISSMVVGIPKLGEMRLYNYGYDQLNRIAKMDAYTGYKGDSSKWGTLNAHGGEYKERIAYDGNGNILKYLRNGYAGTLSMDSLTYKYDKDVSGLLRKNRLLQVKDSVADGNYTEDIDNQSANNYVYDSIGNLVKDTKEGISDIKWTVYGKIRKITKTDGTVISYTYDVSENRISKAVTKNDSTTTTWYARDAQGNTMAIYTGVGNSLKLSEHHLYGSNRLGVWNRNVDMDAVYNADNLSFVQRNKSYEFGSHLGNVMVTISDKKHGVDIGGDGIIDFYLSDIVTATDYAPFGMGLVNRKFRADGTYRYGFNGKENDNDVKGEGDQQDYGMRVYDPRLGRFLSIDPLTEDYPWYTPYQFAGNKPIEAIDLDGAEEYYINLASRVRFEIQGNIAYNKYAKENASKFYWAQNGMTYNYKPISVSPKLTQTQEQVKFERQRNASEARRAEKLKPENLARNFGNGLKKGIKNFIEEPFKEFDAAKRSLDGGDLVGFLDHGKNVVISVAPYGAALKAGRLGRLATVNAEEGLAINTAKGSTFYRAMSNAEFTALKNNNGLTYMKGKELFVSTEAAYSRAYLQKPGYDVLVQFNMKSEAVNYFKSVGMFHRTAGGSSGWAARGNLLWKSEQGALNLGIQQNTHMFNPLIKNFEPIK